MTFRHSESDQDIEKLCFRCPSCLNCIKTSPPPPRKKGKFLFLRFCSNRRQKLKFSSGGYLFLATPILPYLRKKTRSSRPSISNIFLDVFQHPRAKRQADEIRLDFVEATYLLMRLDRDCGSHLLAD